jgi:hypothetical protein
MNVAIGKARAEEGARPDAVAVAFIDRDTGAAKIWAIVRRCDSGHEPENQEKGIDCELCPSIPGKEMCPALWTRGRDEIDDDWKGYGCLCGRTSGTGSDATKGGEGG